MFSSANDRHTAKLQVIKEISRFRTTTSPVITKQNRKTLQAKLAIQKQSTAATSQRVLNNKLYLRYNKNPFSSVKDKKHRFSNSHSFSSARVNEDKKKRGKRASQMPQQRTILDQMHEDRINVEEEDTKVKRFQKINKILRQSQKITNRIANQVQKQKQIKPDLKTKQQTSNPKIKRANTFALDREQNRFKYENLELEQILGIKEQNYFLHQGRKQINIFRCPNNNDQNLNSYQRLERQNFSFTAMIQKINWIKIPIFKEISRLGRSLLSKKNVNQREVIQLLDTNEVSYKQSQLVFLDIMNFASGRILPEYLTKINNEMSYKPTNTEGSDASSEVEDFEIIYRKNYDHKINKFEAANEQRHEVVDFSHIKLTQSEKNYEQRCKKLKQRVKVLLDQKEYMLENRISDNAQLEAQQNKIQETYHDYLTKGQEDISVSKMVRRNKQLKDRKQVFRLSNFITGLQYKNEKDKIFIQGGKQ